MHAFVDPYNKNNTIFTPTDIINEFIKKLAAENSALEKEIKKIAFDKQMIEHVQAEVLKARDKVIGCTSCCPFCGAICIDNTLNHSGQHTANHYTTAFGGCRDNNNVILV